MGWKLALSGSGSVGSLGGLVVEVDEYLEGPVGGVLQPVADSLRQKNETLVANLFVTAFADADFGRSLGIGALFDRGLHGLLICRRDCVWVNCERLFIEFICNWPAANHRRHKTWHDYLPSASLVKADILFLLFLFKSKPRAKKGIQLKKVKIH
jgi:hypothetical protein